MITITGPKEFDKKELNRLAERVFYKSIELLGGLLNLAEYRTLTWLPSLARACFTVVLKNEYLKTEREIAEFLGISVNTVRNILRADPDKAIYRVEHLDELTEEEKKRLKVHIAGGIAKLAYDKVKTGEDSSTVLAYTHSVLADTMKDYCDAPWAYLVLKYTKGIDYPVADAEVLLKALIDAPIKDFDVKEVITGIEYPIKNPAELLKKIKEYIKK